MTVTQFLSQSCSHAGVGGGADHAANRQSPSRGNSGVFANSEAVRLAQRAWTGMEAGKTS